MQKVPTVCCILVGVPSSLALPEAIEVGLVASLIRDSGGVLNILHVTARHGICQIFYTNKIPEILNFTRKNA